MKTRQPSYYVYLLECADATIYTGVTTDVARRFSEHQQGSGARYTRARKACRILYAEKQKTRSLAQKREAEIKSWPRAKKLELIRSKPCRA